MLSVPIEYIPMYSAWMLLTVTYFIGFFINDFSIIDISWGLGFVLQ